jgi:hypothetical protein
MHPSQGRLALLMLWAATGTALDPSCSCQQFCSGTCAATNAGTPEQLAMFRLTPGNVTELEDKDTGGSAGDMGFVFQKLRAFSQCTPDNANTVECFLTLNPVVKLFYVDVDGKYGPFMRCNPLPFPEHQDSHTLVDTKHWGCFPWHGRAPRPWDPSSGGATSCADQVYCPALMNVSVGRDPAMHHAFDPERPNIAEYFEGEWYSLPAQGKCPPGRTPGDGGSPSCSWRLAPQKVGKTINASCLLDRVLPLVEKNGAACFNQCPMPLNRTTECYYRCVDPSVMGGSAANGTVAIEPVSRVLMVDAWNKAFASTDPAKGGCADVTKSAPAAISTPSAEQRGQAWLRPPAGITATRRARKQCAYGTPNNGCPHGQHCQSGECACNCPLKHSCDFRK